jgi:hypothetical protein
MSIIQKAAVFALAFFLCGLLTATEDQKIYRGSDVPEGWNGNWPAELLTVPEKTDYARTTSSYEIHEFINTMKWNSENVHVVNMFVTTMRKVGSAMVLANPRVTSPEEAKASGKAVVYLQGDIHPGAETETKEALLMLTRDILLGERKYLLDDLIIIVTPSINVDGTDTWSTGPGIGSPHLGGLSRNALGINLNRDAIKLESIEIKGLYETIFNPWDPVLIYDGHGISGWYEYNIVYTTSTVPAAHPAPRGYVWDTLFPAIRESTRKNFGLEVFTHCDLTPTYDGIYYNYSDDSPPTVYSSVNAWWTTEAKFVAAAYGLRNRMSILAETGSRAGNPNYEKRIYVHYALVAEILDYSAKHGKEMVEICRRADEEVVNQVLTKAESGELTNFVEGTYESYGKIDVPAYSRKYSEAGARTKPGTSVVDAIPPGELGPPDLLYTVDYLAKPVGTKEAKVPRGYLFPADMAFIAEKLKTHNVKVEALDKPIKVTGEQYIIDKLVKSPRGGYDMVTLEGGFAVSAVKEFPAGTFHVDMAQPAANTAFYCLEPQAADGFVGWDVLTEYLQSIGVDERSIVYPFYKYFKILE